MWMLALALALGLAAACMWDDWGCDPGDLSAQEPEFL